MQTMLTEGRKIAAGWRANVVLVFACFLAPALAQEAAKLSGLTLSEALARFENEGLRIFYSSDLVRQSMRVTTEPESVSATVRVREILEPHGLMLRRGLNDTWLIVRQPQLRQFAEPQGRPEIVTPAAQTIDPPPLEELIVAASKYEISRSGNFNVQRVGERDLEYMPDLGDDVIRAVARLPGIASNGFSALSHFRGGEPGETLVRLDGMRLYDPFHLRDFQAVFSAVDSRIVRSMNVYTGGFPAVYGDRMSGVVDVQTLSVEDDLTHEVGASFFHTSVLSSGRFGDGRGEWLASARRSNLAALYRNFSELTDRPRYSDVFTKLRYDVSDKLTVKAYVLRAEDRIELADDEDREESATARQRDVYTWLRLEHDLGPLTSGTTLLARTTIDGHRSGTSAKSGVSTGTLADSRKFTLTTLQSDWSRLLGSRMLLDFGAAQTQQSGRYAYEDDVEFDVTFALPGAPAMPERARSVSLQPQGRHQTLYGTLRFDWNERFATEFGLRANRQEFGDAAYVRYGPRLGLRFALSERSSVRASWGRYFQTQSINELQVSDGVTEYHAPQRNEQLVLGFDRRLAGNAIVRLEVYDKQLGSLRPRFENLLNARVLLPELKPDRIAIAPETAHARGIELALEGETMQFDWWGSLSWSKVEDEFAERNIVRSWDQTWALNAGFHRDTGKWSYSAALIYRSGWPTSTTAFDATATFPTVQVSARNDSRLAAFASLDMRLARRFSFERSSVSVFLELVNVTERSNPCCQEYEIGDEDEAGLFVIDERSYLPSIPSLGFLWTF